jgi:acyl-CoA synthetase (AMP-forming)/AMP-acid ligase II
LNASTAEINVASHLSRMAAAEPDRAALHYPTGRGRYITLTFAQLDDLSNRLAHAFDCIGIRRGVRTAVMVPPTPDFFALTFALFKVAAVPVLVDPGMGVKNLGRCLAEAEPQAFIGIPKAHLARRLFGWGKRTIRTTVNVGRWRFFCNFSLEQLKQPRHTLPPNESPDVAADETAAILFTSGSTGVAKGAVYSHGNFAAQVEMLKATYGIEPGEIDLCTFPLFALFGPALGMTCVIPDMDPTRPARIDPRKAVAQIEQFGVTNLFGSPAVIRRLGEFADSSKNPSPGPSPKKGGEEDKTPPSLLGKGAGGLGLPTLRRVISAGAPASAPAIERFSRLLPEGVQVYTPYGATEALPVANIGSREILNETRHLTDQGKGVCIGRPVAGMQVFVIPISDKPIPEWDESLSLPAGEIGEFVVRGPVVTREYFNRPDATRLAKIRDPRTGDILHRMGDVGYFDDQGRLWFCGRKAHRVVTPRGTLFTDMVEPVFNTVPGVFRTALVGVSRAGVTYPAVCVETAGFHNAPPGVKVRLRPWSEIELELDDIGARFDHTRLIRTFLRHSGSFPVDVRHNSKIFREKLATWADKVLGKHWNPGDNTPVRHAGTGAAS